MESSSFRSVAKKIATVRFAGIVCAAIGAAALLATSPAVHALEWPSFPWLNGSDKPAASVSGVPAYVPAAYAGEEQATIDTVKRSVSSVVSVVVSKNVTVGQRQQMQIDPFFNDFFNFPGFQIVPPQGQGNDREQAKPKQEKREVGGGTAFMVNAAKGLLLTNKHVVVDPDAQYEVITNEGKRVDAKVIGLDPVNDLAVLQVTPNLVPELKLGDSAGLQIGQTVIAIGNALGEFRNTVTKGIVSGVGRSIVAGGNGESERLDDVIQTDAGINPGNSGGPLLNLRGEVIGINSAVSSNAQQIGFAIPVNVAKQVVASVEKTGKIERPYLGVRYRMLTRETAKEEKIPYEYGAFVVGGEGQRAVLPDSPAYAAGLREGDVILEANGEKLQDGKTLASVIQRFSPGDALKLKVWSPSGERAVSVTLGTFKEDKK